MRIGPPIFYGPHRDVRHDFFSLVVQLFYQISGSIEGINIYHLGVEHGSRFYFIQSPIESGQRFWLKPIARDSVNHQWLFVRVASWKP